MIPNLAIVDDPANGLAGVYRGAQPVAPEDWEKLRYLGVTRIIKLNTDSEGDDSASGIPDILKCPITLSEQLLTEPDLNSLRTAVAFIEPGTFIHCGSTERTRHALLVNDFSTAGGQDRTGLVVGAYRLKQGVLKAEAHKEMIKHGFHKILFGLDRAWADL